ncbi:MAG: hypothetical protein M5T61_21285, partial [Acidimicrobiia bacterium]|nr:hypothetical protein [Acidimicrobiia bacterium]
MGEECGGLLVEDRTDVDAYVERLCRVLDDPVECRAIGLRGRERVLAEFSLEQMGARHGASTARSSRACPSRRRPNSAPVDDAP